MITLTATYRTVGINITSSFAAAGGVAPYTYSVIAGGAGGTIDSSGIYTAPSELNLNVTQSYDTILVTDSLNAKGFAQILVTSPIGLVCDIIQNQMGLENGRVYEWNQKIYQPTDSKLYIIVSEMFCKPFANNNYYDGTSSGLINIQTINMFSQLSIDIISRSSEARERKEEVMMALNSVYAEQQQEANSFYIGRLPHSQHFINLSNVDGAAIPYRYNLSIAIQYAKTKRIPVPYFSNFSDTIATNP